MLEVVGSNFGGGRKGALFGLYEVEEGYMRCVFCVMCWYVVGVGFGLFKPSVFRILFTYHFPEHRKTTDPDTFKVSLKKWIWDNIPSV